MIDSEPPWGIIFVLIRKIIPNSNDNLNALVDVKNKIKN